MAPDNKKTALRMIPYGLYVLTAQVPNGRIAAATVNWVTQVSFKPPLVVVGVKVGSGPHAVIKETGVFALNVLGKAQQAAAFAFFKPVTPEGNTIGGEPFRTAVPALRFLSGLPATSSALWSKRWPAGIIRSSSAPWLTPGCQSHRPGARTM